MRATGWKPEMDFERGLKATVEWYRSNPEWIAHVRPANISRIMTRIMRIAIESCAKSRLVDSDATTCARYNNRRMQDYHAAGGLTEIYAGFFT